MELKSVTFKATQEEIEFMNDVREWLAIECKQSVSKNEAWATIVHYGKIHFDAIKAKTKSPEFIAINDNPKAKYQTFNPDVYKSMEIKKYSNG